MKVIAVQLYVIARTNFSGADIGGLDVCAISHETIYVYIRLHPELHVYCGHKMKYRCHVKQPKVTKATNILEELQFMRPKEANGLRFGD